MNWRRAYFWAGKNEPRNIITFTIFMDDLQLADKQLKPTYSRIRQWVSDHYDGMYVPTPYVAEIKDQLGLPKQYRYTGEKKHHQPHCPPEKAAAIKAAFAYYGVEANTKKEKES